MCMQVCTKDTCSCFVIISDFINLYFSGETTSAVVPSTNNVFGLGFGKNGSKVDVPVCTTSSSIFAAGPPQTSTPVFGTVFNKNAALTSMAVSLASTSSSSNLFNLSAAATQPSSTSLPFGSFSNLGSSVSTKVSSSSSFGDTNRSETTGNSAVTPLTFGALPRPSFEVQSSDSKPLFPIVSQSTSSMFGTGNANKPHTGTTGSFGRAFAVATAGRMAKENKETVAEEKIRGLDTSNLTALVIKNIPDTYNKNAWVKRFYSRFGEVTKVLCSAAKNSASVVFKTHVSKVPRD